MPPDSDSHEQLTGSAIRQLARTCKGLEVYAPQLLNGFVNPDEVGGAALCR